MDEKNYEKANEVAREIDYKIKTTINYIDLPFYIYIYKRRQDGDLQGCESAEVSMDRNGKLFRISKISLSELNIALSSKKNLFIDSKKHHLTKEQFKALESIKENAENKLQNVKEKYKDFLKIELPFKLTCISDIMRPAGKNDFEHLVEKNDYKVVSIFELKNILNNITNNKLQGRRNMCFYKFYCDGNDITDTNKQQLEQLLNDKVEEYYNNYDYDDERE